jgi:lysophospholipase L1-like esterase
MIGRKRGVVWSLAMAIVAMAGVTASTRRAESAQVTPSATPTPHLMTFAGDSITQGYGASTAANTVVNRMGEIRPNWWIRNYSVGGASMSGCPASVKMNANDIVPLHGNPVVVFLGTNDWACNIPIAEFRSDYSTFVDILDGQHPQVICVTPIWRADDGKLNSAGSTLEDYRKAIAQICTAGGHPVIDGSSLVPHDQNNYLDGLHPNDAGYSYYAQHLAEAMDRFVSP